MQLHYEVREAIKRIKDEDRRNQTEALAFQIKELVEQIERITNKFAPGPGGYPHMP